jgi:phenylpropionate dioxygenase-like ring-hydroxylating dioxygenase large terminal subunit
MEFQGHVLAEAVTTLPRELYVSNEIFEAERERVFRTRWLAVGRTAEIPAAGDSLVGNPAGESVLFVRG